MRRKFMTKNRIIPAALALTLLGALPAAADAARDAQIKIEAGEAFFGGDCRRCHATDADKASYGPLLDGVVGRMAGKYPGYPYSPALANAGFVWTEGALRAWMEDNTGLMPGTKMRHVGITDPVVQDFILAYLTSLGTAK
jgi:cytochrome c